MPNMTQDQFIKYEKLRRADKENFALKELEGLANKEKARITELQDAHMEALKIEELKAVFSQSETIETLEALESLWRSQLIREKSAELGEIEFHNPASTTFKFVDNLKHKGKSHLKIKAALKNFFNIQTALDQIYDHYCSLSAEDKNELLFVRGSERNSLLLAAIANNHKLTDAILESFEAINPTNTAHLLTTCSASGISPLIAAVLMQNENATKKILALIGRLDSRFQKIALEHTSSSHHAFFDPTEGRMISHPFNDSKTKGKNAEAIAAILENQAIIDMLAAFKTSTKTQETSVESAGFSVEAEEAEETTIPSVSDPLVNQTVDVPATFETPTETQEASMESATASVEEEGTTPIDRNTTVIFTSDNNIVPPLSLTSSIVEPVLQTDDATKSKKTDAPVKMETEETETSALEKKITSEKQNIELSHFGRLGSEDIVKNYKFSALSEALRFLNAGATQTAYDTFNIAFNMLSTWDKRSALFNEVHTIAESKGLIRPEPPRAQATACFSCLLFSKKRPAPNRNTGNLNDDTASIRSFVSQSRL